VANSGGIEPSGKIAAGQAFFSQVKLVTQSPVQQYYAYLVVIQA
jgi:hypothetical protein